MSYKGKSDREIRANEERRGFRSWGELRASLLKDPEIKKGYDALEWKYALIHALYRERTKKGYSQDALAKKIGTKQSAISRFESGRENPTIQFVQKLSEALGLEVSIQIRKAKTKKREIA